MRTQLLLCLTAAAALAVGPSHRADAAFHFMQIEQIIGGVNGDTTAQAIQLRMRLGGQNIMGNSRLFTRDAAGANETVISDPTTSVANGAAGSRVLIATPNFANYTDVTLASDFVMDPIPLASLAAGQVSFNNNGSSRYWVLSWGGAGFTGDTTGLTTNDADGDFGPPVDMALPSTSLQALLFQGPANAPSTTNAADYSLTAGAATFINNAGASFTLVTPEPDNANFDDDDDIDGKDFLIWQDHFGGPGLQSEGDANHSGHVGADDLTVWQEQFGTPPPLRVFATVPEPGTLSLLLFCAAFLGHSRRD